MWLLSLAFALDFQPAEPPTPVVPLSVPAPALTFGDARLRCTGEEVSFSPSGSRLACASWRGLTVFELPSGEPIARLPIGASAAHFLDDGHVRAFMADGQRLDLDLSSGEATRRPAHDDDVVAHVGWGDTALSIDDEGYGWLWRAEQRASVGRLAHIYDSGATGDAWAGPGGIVAERSDGALQLWSAQGEELGRIDAKQVVAAAVTVDGVLTLDDPDDGRLAVLKQHRHDGTLVERFELPVEPFWAAALSPDGTHLAVWGERHGLRVWSVATRTMSHQSHPLAGRDHADHLVFAPTSDRLALRTGNDIVVVELPTGQVSPVVPPWYEPNEVLVDRHLVVDAGDDATIVYDLAAPTAPPKRLPIGGERALRDERLYAAHFETLWAYDLDAGTALWTESNPTDWAFHPIAVAPNGERMAHVHHNQKIVVHGRDGTIERSWPIDNGKYDHEVFDLVFADDSQRLATASAGEAFQRNLVTVWDVGQPQHTHQHVAYSYDILGLVGDELRYDDYDHLVAGPPGERGKTVLEGFEATSQSTDGRVVLGTLSDESRKPTVLRVGEKVIPMHSHWAPGSVSPDGQRVALSLSDGRVAVWQTDDLVGGRGKATRAITHTGRQQARIDAIPERLVPAFARSGDRLVPQPPPDEDDWGEETGDTDGDWQVDGDKLMRGEASWLVPGRRLSKVKALGKHIVWVSGWDSYTEIIDTKRLEVVARLQGQGELMTVDGGQLRNGRATWSWPGLKPLRKGPLHDQEITAIAARGPLVATGDAAGSVMVWRDDRLQYHFWGEATSIYGLSLGGPSLAIAADTPDGSTVWVLAAATGEDAWRLNNTYDFLHVQLSPDGAHLVLLSEEEYGGTVELWSVAERRKLWSIDGGFHHADFASHGRWMVLSGYEQPLVQVIDTTTGALQRVLAMPDGFEHSEVAVLDDRSLLGWSTHEETANRLWIPAALDLELPSDRDGALRGGGGRLATLAWDDEGEEVLTVYDPTGDALWTGAAEQGPMVWNGDLLHVVTAEKTVATHRIPPATASAKRPEGLGDLAQLVGIHRAPPPIAAARRSSVRGEALAAGPKGTLAVASGDRQTSTLRLVDAQGEETLAETRDKGRGYGDTLLAQADGELVWFDGTTLRTLKGGTLEDLGEADCEGLYGRQGKVTCFERYDVVHFHDGEVRRTQAPGFQAAASLDGSQGLVSHHRAVHRWSDDQAGDRVARHWGEVRDIALSGARWVVAGSGVVELDDGTLLQGMPAEPMRVAWSPDAGRIAVGDAAGNVWIWSPDGQPVARLDAVMNRLVGMVWAADGQQLVTLDHEGLRWWPTP